MSILNQNPKNKEMKLLLYEFGYKYSASVDGNKNKVGKVLFNPLAKKKKGGFPFVKDGG